MTRAKATPLSRGSAWHFCQIRELPLSHLQRSEFLQVQMENRNSSCMWHVQKLWKYQQEHSIQMCLVEKKILSFFFCNLTITDKNPNYFCIH